MLAAVYSRFVSSLYTHLGLEDPSLMDPFLAQWYITDYAKQ